MGSVERSARGAMVLAFFASCGGAAPAPERPRGVDEAGGTLAENLAATERFLASRPRYERPLDDGFTPVPGLPDLSARTCGGCHVEIYEEWRVSTHALAWVDPQFQAEIAKSDNRWMCVNCHTPLLSQQPSWAVGLVDGDVERPRRVPNPSFSAAFQDEGITCAACHVRGGVIHGPGGSTAAPHPVRADADFLGSAVCERCHQAEATYPGKNFVCTFDTGDEWRAGPYPAQGKDCRTCHMPAVDRPVSAGAPARATRRHWWRGAGIPKIPGVHPPPEANLPGLDVTARGDGDAIVLALANARAGHDLPTGDPERWVQVEVTPLDASGAPVGTPSVVRIGQTWEWWPAPRRVGDNRLKPGETREVRVARPAGAARVRVVASSHRMSEENARYNHLGEGYPLSVITHRLEFDL